MTFSDLELDKQIEVINNSFEIANNNFDVFIADDVKNTLNSFTDITNKYTDLKKETSNKVSNIHLEIIKMFKKFIEDKRAYAQAKEHYLLVFSHFEILNYNESNPYSENMILIYIHTFFQTLYFKIIKYYEKDIENNVNVLVDMLRYGTLFNNKYGKKVEVDYVKHELHILDDMIVLRKSYDDYFFYDALLLYGSRNVKKDDKLKGFVNKLRGVLSADRDSINNQIEKLPKRTFKEYLPIIDYTISS